MKKITLAFTLLFCSILQTQAQSETIEISKKLGLVGYLTYVKSVAEGKIQSLLADPRLASEPTKTPDFHAAYNKLKLSVDLLINQLNADLAAKNSMKSYKSINQHIIDEKNHLPEYLKNYKAILQDIEDGLTTLLLQKYGGGALANASLSDILSIATFGFDFIKDQRDYRAKKVATISAIIKELKLKSINELTKPAEKK